MSAHDFDLLIRAGRVFCADSASMDQAMCASTTTHPPGQRRYTSCTSRIWTTSLPPREREKEQLYRVLTFLEVKKQIRLLTAERDTSIQNLLTEALNDQFAKNGKPEIAPLKER